MKRAFIYSLLVSFTCISYKSQDIEKLSTEANNTIDSSADCLTPGEYLQRGDESFGDFEIMGYLPWWGYTDRGNSEGYYRRYHYSDITQLNISARIAYRSVTEDRGLVHGGNLDNTRQVDFGKMITWFRRCSDNPHMKIFLTLTEIKTTLAHRKETAKLLLPENRTRTINWLMTNYIDKYDLDGIDIDFEDHSLDAEYMGLHYADFIDELCNAMRDRQARGRRKLCTATMAGSDHRRSLIATPKFINAIDMLGLQTYSPDKMDHIRWYSGRDQISHAEGWLSKGLPWRKMSFGLALWSSIADASKAEGNQLAPAGTPGGYNWIDMLKQGGADSRAYLTSSFHTPGITGRYEQRYNGLYEIRRKAEWAKDNGALGVFVWDIAKEPTKNDPSYRKYSYLKLLDDWKNNPNNYLPIKAVTTLDYYRPGRTITIKLLPSLTREGHWIGVYEFDTSQPNHIGESLGLAMALPASSNLAIPAAWTNQMDKNVMYIFKILKGPTGSGVRSEDVGTTHPIYVF